MQKIFLALTAVILLSGCSVQSETWVNQAGRAQVTEDQFADYLETSKLNPSTLQSISSYYQRFGNGPMNVVVAYDPLSKTNTVSKAEKALGIIRKGLFQNGVRNINAISSPVKGSGDISTTLVSFPALTASAPASCGTMPGYKDPSQDIPNDTNIKPPYGYGCTIETLLAKQVARPSDLMGAQGGSITSDGRRAERVLSTRGYYGDSENQKLEGESVSQAE